MYKHIIYLLVLSVIVLFTIPYCNTGLHALLTVHSFIVNELGKIFAGGEIGHMIKNVVSVLIIPFGIGLIIFLIHWLFKRGHMPLLPNIIWALWFILMTAIVMKG